MKKYAPIWMSGLIGTIFILVAVILLATPSVSAISDDPWAEVPTRVEPTDHSALLPGPYETGQEVTAACLECHENAAHEVAQTSHYTWESGLVEVPWREEPVSTGKANSINNFCIGIQGNWTGCTRCHAGYGWDSADFAFAETDVDCLVCHDQSGQYVKGGAGLPVESVDLALAAQSVGTPSRQNCGGCHFNGGGGNGVKHGDLDESMYFPADNQDVHMGRNNFLCVDCHQAEEHLIGGRAITSSVDDANQIACTNCHNAEAVHTDSRITSHVDTVACQTCHIPAGALRDPTKTIWDWSQAGDLTREESQHEYLAIKGEFVYANNIRPTYLWYSGGAQRYILGDVIDPTQVTNINYPWGSMDDPQAMIFPFKLHVAIQPYDTINNVLLQPVTGGDGGYWTTFDWDSALRMGAEITNLPYSGSYGFTETHMYLPLTHMVQPSENALQCTDCHSDNGRMDWEALGYYGDPIYWGGRGE